MTKVLFVITKSNWGGAQRYVYDLATNPQPGFETVVVAGGHGQLIERLRDAGVRTIPINSLARDISITKDLWSFIELWHIFKRERPDIVHLNSSKAGAMGALAARLAGVPRIIFTAHGWFHNEPKPLIVRTLAWVLHGLTQLLVHNTIAVSKSIIQTAPLQRHTTLIYNGIHQGPLMERNEARLALQQKGAIFRDTVPALGTIGELHANKGHDVLIRALAYISTPYTLSIIGEGERRTQTESLISDLRLSDTRLLGHVPDAASYLPAFDLFILPSRTEAFAYVLLEAGRAGLPVIASRVGGIPELIEDGSTGVLVEKDNPEALGSAITLLLKNRERMRTYGETLKQKVEHVFSLEQMITRTYAHYAA